jgi:hypothetical protein
MWRQALQEYTGNQEEWNITAIFVKSEAELESCDIKIYIYDKYSDFPDYPAQTGAYTSLTFKEEAAGTTTLICESIFRHLYYMATARQK